MPGNAVQDCRTINQCQGSLNLSSVCDFMQWPVSVFPTKPTGVSFVLLQWYLSFLKDNVGENDAQATSLYKSTFHKTYEDLMRIWTSNNKALTEIVAQIFWLYETRRGQNLNGALEDLTLTADFMLATGVQI
ncbi:hypothetical protein PoB_002528700 [Plakobranchus ocellatus]|uniref:Uncharacterized protein n=1 Tax=Plakobranchus ocellatus TaxID=259542 RepID=A0AAV3ZW17_9GAST|nr:hypothetical protein PoB_002528700 [Plakobranchus ocellatus]